MSPPADYSPPSGGILRNEVEVSFFDGPMLSGTVMGFNPQRPTFFVHPNNPDDEVTSREIGMGSVKTIAFLRNASTAGKLVTFPPTARLVTVRFMDQAVMNGVTQSYGGARQGIFLVPTEEERFERVYVPVSAIREVVSVKRLGEILTEQGMVTAERVNDAIHKQQELRNEPIGQILVKNRVISDEQLAQGLSIQRKSGKKIGEILIEQGFIEGVQLDEALVSQRSQRDKKLGQIMVELGYATYKMIGIALAIQYNMPFIDLSSQSVDPALRELVPADLAKQYTIMPLSLQGNILTIAVIDPIEHGAEDALRARTGLTVIMAVATPQEISRAIGRYYDS